MNKITQFLLLVGFVKIGRKSTACRYDKTTGTLTYIYPERIVWPFHVAPAWIWRHPIVSLRMCGFFYVFRNMHGVVKYREGRLLPIRWGFGIMGLVEFGDRG